MPRSRQSSVTLHMLLLSLLNRGFALSGYDIASWLKEPVPFIWPVKHSQIYPSLAALESRGDVAGEWKEQKGRPRKKSYRITRQGRQRLREWLSEPRPAPTHEETILVAYNHKLVGTDAAKAALVAYRARAEDEKSQLEARWKAIADDAADDPSGIRAPFEFGIQIRLARMAWCDWFEAQLAGEHRARRKRPA